MISLQKLYEQLTVLMAQGDPETKVQILTRTGALKPIEHVAWHPQYGVYVKEAKRTQAD